MVRGDPYTRLPTRAKERRQRRGQRRCIAETRIIAGQRDLAHAYPLSQRFQRASRRLALSLTR